MNNKLIEENIKTFGSAILILNNRKRLCFLIKCAQCDIEHHKEEHELTRGIRRNKKFFCSRNCRDNYKSTSIQANCKNCNNIFMAKQMAIRKSKSGNLFCSSSCAAIYNNTRRTKKIKLPKQSKPVKLYKTNYCPLCNGVILGYNKYCNMCASKARSIASKKYAHAAYTAYILRWKSGEISGGAGEGIISHHIRKYMFEKHNSKCSICSWAQINPTTGKIPLEIDHINGDWSNHKEDNLRLLCPSCHALTPTFRSLNNGSGRINRKLKRQNKNLEKGVDIEPNAL